jgi:hypothetical protein
MVSRTKILLVSIIILAIILFFNQFLFSYIEPFLGEFWGKIILFLLGLIPLSMDIISELVSSWVEEKKKKDIIKGYINELEDFLKHNTCLRLRDKSQKELRPLRDDVYREIFEKNFELDDNQVNSLILLVLIHHYSFKKRREFFDLIQSYTSILKISDLSEEAKLFFTAYDKVKNPKKEKLNDLQNFFLGIEELNYRELAKDFCNKFSKDAIFRFIREDLNQSEELRRILIELIMSKKIPLLGVREDVIKTLEGYLLKKRLYTRTYLLIGHKLGNKLKTYLSSKLPSIIGGGWSHNVPGKGKVVFSVYLVKARDIETLEKFYQKMKSMIEQDHECFMFVTSADFMESKEFVFPSDTKFSSPRMKEGFEIANYIKSGFYHADVDIWSVITQFDIGINQLLSSIPFTVFVTDLSEKERTLLIKNYFEIKEKFKIHRLDDWKSVNEKNLADYISKINDGRFSIPTERCLEISKTIKEQSNEFDKSLKPLDI